MKTLTLKTKSFYRGKRNYFIDYKRAVNDSNYIRISRTDKLEDDSYQRSSIIFFKDDLPFLIGSLSMLITELIHMEKCKFKDMKAETLGYESFENGKRNYFYDLKRTSNNSYYLKISRTDKLEDETYLRSSIIFFEEDIPFFIECLSALLTSIIPQGQSNSSSQRQTMPTEVVSIKRGIKSWAPEKRPREKLILQGPDMLSDAELIALLIGSGTTSQTAVGLSTSVLKSIGHDLDRLSGLGLKQLTRFRGIGNAKAVSILAAMELSKRLNKSLGLPFKLQAV
jgi:DNA repair protein RadC